jgi:hypothetical protein
MSADHRLELSRVEEPRVRIGAVRDRVIAFATG